MAKCDLDKRTTNPCHCDRCTGTVRYASATSLTAPCDPGGSEDRSRETMGKVLYDVGIIILYLVVLAYIIIATSQFTYL